MQVNASAPRASIGRHRVLGCSARTGAQKLWKESLHEVTVVWDSADEGVLSYELDDETEVPRQLESRVSADADSRVFPVAAWRPFLGDVHAIGKKLRLLHRVGIHLLDASLFFFCVGLFVVLFGAREVATPLLAFGICGTIASYTLKVTSVSYASLLACGVLRRHRASFWDHGITITFSSAHYYKSAWTLSGGRSSPIAGIIVLIVKIFRGIPNSFVFVAWFTVAASQSSGTRSND